MPIVQRHFHSEQSPSALRLPSRSLNHKPIFAPTQTKKKSALVHLSPSPHAFLCFHVFPLSHNKNSPSKHPLYRLTDDNPILVLLVLLDITVELHNLHQRAIGELLLVVWFAEFARGKDFDF